MGAEPAKCSALGGCSMLQAATHQSEQQGGAGHAGLVLRMCLCARHPPPHVRAETQRRIGEGRRAAPGQRPGQGRACAASAELSLPMARLTSSDSPSTLMPNMGSAACCASSSSPTSARPFLTWSKSDRFLPCAAGGTSVAAKPLAPAPAATLRCPLAALPLPGRQRPDGRRATTPQASPMPTATQHRT